MEVKVRKKPRMILRFLKGPRLTFTLSIYIFHMHPSQLSLFCLKVISHTRKPFPEKVSVIQVILDIRTSNKMRKILRTCYDFEDNNHFTLLIRNTA